MQLVVDDVLLTADSKLLDVLAIGFALLLVLQAAISVLRSWLVVWLSTHLNFELAGGLFRHLTRLPLEFFAKRQVGDVVSRFGSLEAIQRTLTTSFVEALVDGVLGIAALVMLFVYSAKLAWIVVGFVIAYALLRHALYRPFRDATEEQIAHGAKRQSTFIETIRGAHSVKVCGRELQRQAQFQNASADTANAGIRVARLQVTSTSSNLLLFGVENLLVIWLAAQLVMDGALTLGMLFAFMSYKMNFTGKAANLIEKVFEYRMLELHADRVADIALTEPEPYSDREAEFSAMRGAVRIEGLGFRYGPQDPWVLRGLDLEIAPGESVAIVGPSGCGKSTLVKILLGLLQPSEGHVLVDGVEVTPHSAPALRSMCGVVLQDDQLFAGTIADNIAFFDEQADLAFIEECAKKAAIHDDILAMPMGFNTLIGDMGGALSGGQKQRVLLARAFYRSPRLLVLDEATSHLDVARERSINDSVRALQVTRIIVAHRAETIGNADRIVRLGTTNLDVDAATRSSVVRAVI
jgi:ATP-binding cassette subfamily B protein RaxB